MRRERKTDYETDEINETDEKYQQVKNRVLFGYYVYLGELAH
jgi:hypothetical protein